MDSTRQQTVDRLTRKKPGASPLCAGDWVQVRSREEILATLDKHGRLDGMPFMPEMLAFCGKVIPVFKRAHKTCDTIAYTGAHKLERTVHLMDTRCDGSAHGGCDAACALYWNEAWIKITPPAGTQAADTQPAQARAGGCSMEQLMAATQKGQDPEKGPRYVCQATNYLDASAKLLSPYDPRQYVEDYRSGNVDMATMLHGALYRVALFAVRRAERIGPHIGLGDILANVLMAWYDAILRLLPKGAPYPRRKGSIPVGEPTPQVGIGDIRPGSRVQVKSYREILGTVNVNNKTRGLLFTPEHVPYCGGEFTVRSLVNQIIDERTGYMIRFDSPSVILNAVQCQGIFGDGGRMFCPRAIYPYWRSAWLRPVVSDSGTGGRAARPLVRYRSRMASPGPCTTDVSRRTNA